MTAEQLTCLWVGRVVVALGGLCLLTFLVGETADYVYRRMGATVAFMQFLRERRRRRGQ